MKSHSAMLTIAITLVGCTSIQSAERRAVPLGVPMRGQVAYPDGSPSVGATVVATTVCQDDLSHLVQKTLTATDGSFVIESFDNGCGKVRFTAEKRDGFWLRTGSDPFYSSPNGTAPEVSVTSEIPPAPVKIHLDRRGGELELRVWDTGAERYIKAGIMVDCPGAWCGAMSTATVADGELYTVFLPPRQYRVSINWYYCGSKTYFPDNKPPSITIDVVEGELRTATLMVDVKAIQARSSYDNPNGAQCRF